MRNIRLKIATILTLALCLQPFAAVSAQDDPGETLPLLITELQTASAASAKQEWVEIYNPNPKEIDIKDWQLQYRAAAKTGSKPEDWKQMVNILGCTADSVNCSTVVLPRSKALLASQESEISGAITLTKDGMATESGQLRLVNAGGEVQDMLGYGQAAESEGSQPAPKLSAGKSLKRRISEDGVFIDTNVNAADFLGGCKPTPQDSPASSAPTCAQPPVSPPPATEDPAENGGTTGTGQQPPAAEGGTANPDTIPPSYAQLLITEVLPDPAQPAQDVSDEFIELYNPGPDPVNAKDYILQTGSDYRYRYVIGDLLIAAGGYVSIKSADSKLALSNSGSGVRLADPSGKAIDEAPNYGNAKEGQSWMRDETGWHWTAEPTPALANILSLPPPKPVAAGATKTPAKKSSASAAPKVPKTPAVTAPKSTKKSTDTAAAGQMADAPPPAPPNPHLWLLWPIGLLVAGYAVYEYRQNIARWVHKIRGAKNTGQTPEIINSS